MSILSVKKHYLKVEPHYKRLTRISLIPWGFYTLFILITSFTTAMESIVWPITIPIWISLLVSGVGLTLVFYKALRWTRYILPNYFYDETIVRL